METQAMVNYNSQDSQLECNDNCWNPYPNYWDTHYYYYHNWYPTYSLPEKSKVEQAFKIMEKLMAKKIVEKLTLKKFVEVVNEIAAVI